MNFLGMLFALHLFLVCAHACMAGEAAAICRFEINGEKCAHCSRGGFFFILFIVYMCFLCLLWVKYVYLGIRWQLSSSAPFSYDPTIKIIASVGKFYYSGCRALVIYT